MAIPLMRVIRKIIYNAADVKVDSTPKPKKTTDSMSSMFPWALQNQLSFYPRIDIERLKKMLEQQFPKEKYPVADFSWIVPETLCGDIILYTERLLKNKI